MENLAILTKVFSSAHPSFGRERSEEESTQLFCAYLTKKYNSTEGIRDIVCCFEQITCFILWKEEYNMMIDYPASNTGYCKSTKNAI